MLNRLLGNVRQPSLWGAPVLLVMQLAAGPVGAGEVLVYDGPGICEGCAEAVARAVRNAGATAVTVSRLTDDDLARADAVAIGGGEDAVDILAGLRPDGVAALQRFVEGGGGFLGICAGAYLAGATLDHEGDTPGLRLFEGDTEGATPYAGRVETIDWMGTPQRLYVQEAPAFVPGTRFRGTILARYADQRAAAIEARYGAGIVVLSGPHPEADAGWLEADGLAPEPLVGPEVAADLVRRVLAK